MEDTRDVAMQVIKDTTAKAELNKIYSGKVIKIMEFNPCLFIKLKKCYGF